MNITVRHVQTAVIVLALTLGFGRASEPIERGDPIPGSFIFKYDDLPRATGLHMSLQGHSKSGLTWRAREIRDDDLSFVQDLMSTSEQMMHFGGGMVRSPEEVAMSLQHYRKMSDEGYPLGSFTVLVEGQHVGHLFINERDEPGVAEIGYVFNTLYKNQGVPSAVVQCLIQRWGPEVRHIGAGNSLDSDTHHSIMRKFQCFNGAPLRLLTATASPSNVASWRILKKAGFRKAASKIENPDEIIMLKQLKMSPSADRESTSAYWEKVEEQLMHLYNGPDALQPGQYYQYMDDADEIWVFSKEFYANPGCKAVGKIKFRFELSL